MTEAKIELPDGTIIEIKGSTDAVKDIVDHVSSGRGAKESKKPEKKAKSKADAAAKDDPKKRAQEDDLAEIVNVIKTCDEADDIEKNVLDNGSEADRALLPLYIVKMYFDNRFPLSTVEISTIVTEFSVSMRRQNALRALKGAGASYVITDGIRKRGVPTLFRLNRRGEKHLKEVIAGQVAKKPTKKASTKRKVAKSQSKKKPTPSARKSTYSRPGPTAMINDLLDEGFFDIPRTIGEIIEYCKESLAFTFKSTDLSPTLNRALRSGKLQRKKNKEGQFEYSAK